MKRLIVFHSGRLVGVSPARRPNDLRAAHVLDRGGTGEGPKVRVRDRGVLCLNS